MGPEMRLAQEKAIRRSLEAVLKMIAEFDESFVDPETTPDAQFVSGVTLDGRVYTYEVKRLR
jgi:hypothetical protein